MKRRMHPFYYRTINLTIGFGLLCSGLVGAAYLTSAMSHAAWEIIVADAAIVLRAAWIYEDLLDPLEDRFPEYEAKQDQLRLSPGISRKSDRARASATRPIDNEVLTARRNWTII